MLLPAIFGVFSAFVRCSINASDMIISLGLHRSIFEHPFSFHCLSVSRRKNFSVSACRFFFRRFSDDPIPGFRQENFFFLGQKKKIGSCQQPFTSLLNRSIVTDDIRRMIEVAQLLLLAEPFNVVAVYSASKVLCI